MFEADKADTADHYEWTDATGDAQIAVYRLFPGVELTFNSVHMESLTLGRETRDTVVEIHHCIEGRIERQSEDEFFYLMPGDLSVAIRESASKAYFFPLRHYHGITIQLNLKESQAELDHLMQIMFGKPLRTVASLCAPQTRRVLRADARIAHLFSELYEIPPHILESYFRLKLMELLLILSDTLQTTAAPLSRAQVRLAHRTEKLLRQDLSRHMTIQEAAGRLNVSPTYLKQAFRSVFGMPFYSYTRVLKMQSAALQLCRTDKPMMEIAGEYGYENGSKFSAAFKVVMGETPNAYRKNHR